MIQGNVNECFSLSYLPFSFSWTFFKDKKWVKTPKNSKNAHSGPMGATIPYFFNIFDPINGFLGTKNMLYVHRYPFLKYKLKKFRYLGKFPLNPACKQASKQVSKLGSKKRNQRISHCIDCSTTCTFVHPYCHKKRLEHSFNGLQTSHPSLLMHENAKKSHLHIRPMASQENCFSSFVCK